MTDAERGVDSFPKNFLQHLTMYNLRVEWSGLDRPCEQLFISIITVYSNDFDRDLLCKFRAL